MPHPTPRLASGKPDETHLVLLTNVRCACGDRALRYWRCTMCRAVKGVCGVHDAPHGQPRPEHCA